MKSIRGFSLIELLVALLLFAGLFVMGTSAVLYFIKSNKSSELRGEVRSGLSQLTAHILRIGRLAGSPPVAGVPQGCVIESSPTALRCKMDFESPPAGTLTEVRFRFDPTEHKVIYEQLNGMAWTTQTTYANVDEFQLCGDAAGCTICSDGNACGTNPDKINTVYQAYLATPPPIELRNRFFRFRIKGKVQDVTAAGAYTRSSEFQSAFFVRNPPRSGDPKLAYLWVGKIFD